MKNLFIGGITAVAVVIMFAFILSFVVQWAWDGVMVSAFALPSLTLLQAFQLNLLAGLLVKSSQTNNNKSA
jgi:hypothetical protein